MTQFGAEDPLVILYVEDDENDVFLVRHVLLKADPEIVLSVARDGEEAQAYLSGREPFADRQKHPVPEIVLMDLKLPRKTGLEVVEWMKSQPGLKEIPVFILSSSAEKEDMERAHQLGVDGYLVKEGSLMGLSEVLSRVATLSGKRRRM